MANVGIVMPLWWLVAKGSGLVNGARLPA